MPASPAGQHTFNALGTFATLLVSDPEALPDATEILIAELAAIDLACSRFRRDSELWRACSASGRPVQVSPLFAAALDVALSAARLTDGDVDPTCGRSLAALGYDRDFAIARQDTGPASLPPAVGGGWRAIRLDTAGGTVTVPDGVLLDLGATAKALRRIARRRRSRRPRTRASWSTWAVTSASRDPHRRAAGWSASRTTRVSTPPRTACASGRRY